MGLGWSLACGLRLSYPHIGVPASGGNLQCSQGFLIPPSLSPLTCLPEAPISSSSISWPCQSGCRTQSKYLMVLIWAPSPWLPCPGIGTWHSPSPCEVLHPENCKSFEQSFNLPFEGGGLSSIEETLLGQGYETSQQELGVLGGQGPLGLHLDQCAETWVPTVKGTF